MYLLQQVLPAVLLAMAVAATGQGLAWWWGTGLGQRALTPVAISLGYGCGHIFVTGWTPFPPNDTTNWLPYFGLAAAAVGVLWDAFPKVAMVRISLLVLLAVGALRLLLQPRFRYGWIPPQGWIWVVCLGCGIALLGMILSALGRRSAVPIEYPFFLLSVGAGTSGALMLSGSMLLGQLAAVLAGALFGALIFSLRSPVGIEGSTPVFCVLLGLLLISGYFFAELPAATAGLLAAAPVLALIPTGRLSGLPRAALRIILVSLPVIAGVILAFRASPPLDY